MKKNTESRDRERERKFQFCNFKCMELLDARSNDNNRMRTRVEILNQHGTTTPTTP